MSCLCRTEAAAPCAGFPQNHEGRGSSAPAFGLVRTHAAAANRMQRMFLDYLLYLGVFRGTVEPDLQPSGFFQHIYLVIKLRHLSSLFSQLMQKYEKIIDNSYECPIFFADPAPDALAARFRYSGFSSAIFRRFFPGAGGFVPAGFSGRAYVVCHAAGYGFYVVTPSFHKCIPPHLRCVLPWGIYLDYYVVSWTPAKTRCFPDVFYRICGARFPVGCTPIVRLW